MYSSGMFNIRSSYVDKIRDNHSLGTTIYTNIKMEVDSSEEEIFGNDLENIHIDRGEKNMEDNDIVDGLSNLFLKTETTKQEVNDKEMCFGFLDELFAEDDEEVITPAIKSEPANVKKDADSDSHCSFNLFGDTDDEDDILNSFVTDKNDKLQSWETKPKVNTKDTMFPQRSGLNQINKGVIGLSLSDSKLTTQDYTGPRPEDDDFCSICRDSHTNPKTLKKCSHSFCTDCIDEYFKIKPECPNCFVAYGVITGNQPEGYMHDSTSKIKLPGYEKYDTIIVSYSFSDGTQTREHPHPGQRYDGTSRTAYLPNCPEGQKVLKLLKASFKRRLTFTVGRSRTTGCDNVVTWNDIHHKTSTCGGQQNFGYPDPTYLTRVQQELAAKGVTEESVNENP